MDTGLDTESRGEPTRSAGTVNVGAAVGVHIAEVIRVVVRRGTLPPTSSGTSRTVSVLDLRVSSGIIGVLCLIVLLVLVRMSSRAENLVFSQQREIVNARGDIWARVGCIARVVRVNRHWLHNVTQVHGERGHQGSRNRRCCRSGPCVIADSACSWRAAITARSLVGAAENIIPKVTPLPASVVSVVRRGRTAPVVHIEILSTA